MNIPGNVKKILSELNARGFEAYAVGGCVRDTLLGREPEDWDITTNALPKEIKSIFRRTVDTGIEHGTVTVMEGKTGYEITTYRLDGNYTDGRHPDHVAFTPSLREDLKRRDFTINAMACSGQEDLVDLFGGQKDLSEKIVRAVGNPDERFTEDALRILRAVRFSAQLGFTLEPKTKNALKDHAPNLVHVSKERIFTELNKILLSDHPEEGMQILESGMGGYIAEHFSEIVLSRKIAELPKEKYFRWAAAFPDSSPEDLKSVLKTLKSDNETAEISVLLLKEMKKDLPENKTSVRFFLSKIGPDRLDDLLVLAKAGFGKTTALAEISETERMKEEVMKAGDCYELKTLALTGTDLAEAGIEPGPEIGKTLRKLLKEVCEHPEFNTKQKLLSML